MRRFLLAAALFAGATSAFAIDKAKFNEGEQLFNRCIPCHGKYANEKPMGKDKDISRLNESEIVAKLTAYANGRSEGAMVAQASLLNQAKIGELAVYIANMHKQYGEELFQLRCSGCHGKDASKSAFGKSGIVAKLSEQEVQQILRNYQSGVYAHGTTANTMKGRAIALSDQEVLELARYIDSLPPK